MKRFQLAAGAVLLSMAAGAHATLITDPVSGPSSPYTVIDFTHPYSYSHSFVSQGFDASTWLIDSASLTLKLYDRANQGNETYIFTVGAGANTDVFSGTNIPNGASKTDYLVDLAASLADLGADGILGVKLTVGAAGQNYEFVSSTLALNYHLKQVVEDPQTPDDANRLPEPASLGLFALGAATAGLIRRRRAR
ncbi:PEP-CTERM sorting domain-containing protein [Zemynaea arenosa]|nr:PEP-CTERM sorting domain-containing protein [Massilia arenosa]